MSKKLTVSVKGYKDKDKDKAIFLGKYIVGIVKQVSQDIFLGDLDGITIGHDYKTALAELDIGFETADTLKPSEGDVDSFGMTSIVKREGKLKSHIVLNGLLVEQFLETQNNDFIFHFIAHECAHVEVNSVKNKCFPGFLPFQASGVQENIRTMTALSCIDEYLVCHIVAKKKHNPMDDYVTIFLEALKTTREASNQAIKNYRISGEPTDVVYAEVAEINSELMRRAGYLLGTIHGQGKKVVDIDEVYKKLSKHWFLPHFKNLEIELQKVQSKYGKWKNLDDFLSIGKIAIKLITEAGLIHSFTPSGEEYIDIPFTSETTPIIEAEQ
ncbi:MAG: hypothetical protein ACR2N8_04700 [Parvibaculales bacterium]